MIEIREDDVTGAETLGLLEAHLKDMHANSPPGSVFALDPSGLRQPDVSVWTAWIGDDIAGVGALKQHDPTLGEIKSMRTHPAHLRKGVAAAILEHILSEARARGLTQISLETGSGVAFEPALTLYKNRGFAEGPAFADYSKTAFSRFYHLQLR